MRQMVMSDELINRVRAYATRGANSTSLAKSVRAFMADVLKVCDLAEADAALGSLEGLPPYNEPPKAGAAEGDSPAAFFVATNEGQGLFRPTGHLGLLLRGTIQIAGASGAAEVSEAMVGRSQAINPTCWDAAYRAVAGGLPVLTTEDGTELQPGEYSV